MGNSKRCRGVAISFLFAALAELAPSYGSKVPTPGVSEDPGHLRVGALHEVRKLRGQLGFVSITGSTLTTQSQPQQTSPQPPPQPQPQTQPQPQPQTQPQPHTQPQPQPVPQPLPQPQSQPQSQTQPHPQTQQQQQQPPQPQPPAQQHPPQHTLAKPHSPTKSQARRLGVPLPVFAFLLAVVSGLSMPIGVLMGIGLSPVNDAIVAAMMAFGAGALLFAVTVELYGHSLHEVEHGNMSMLEMNAIMLAAIGGALFYLSVNKALEGILTGDKGKRQHGVVGYLQEMMSLHKKETNEAASRSWKKVRMAVTKAVVLAKMQATPRMAGGQHSSEAEQGYTEKCRARLREVMEDAMSQVADENAGEERKARDAARKEQKEKAAKAKLVALEMFVGLLIDGIPEGILMGIMAAEGHLTPVLVVSLFIANFPEAFASASLLKAAEMSTPSIFGMWCGLCVLIGLLCGVSCWFLLYCFPNFGDGDQQLPHHWLLATASVEGITGGCMIACVAAVMLPEAFERAGRDGNILLSSGFMCVAGFLCSVCLKANGG